VRAPRCPVCGKPRKEAYRPFCSRRCADVDLQRWLAGIHRISGDEQTGEDETDEGRIALGPPEET
jgi:endogenous inhibitor of DNA gyrase (YacG/DUF329 family)